MLDLVFDFPLEVDWSCGLGVTDGEPSGVDLAAFGWRLAGAACFVACLPPDDLDEVDFEEP